MPKFRCPIHKNFIEKRSYDNSESLCRLTQYFGQNKNALFYGPNGHEAWDLKTIGDYKWKQSYGDFVKVPRTDLEKKGRIPLVACFGGLLTPVLQKNKQLNGWGLYLTADPEKNVQYRALYWHIESLWDSVGGFKGIVKMLLRRQRVRAGAMIAIAGNNGLSTGPHLHFEIQKRDLLNGKWSKWVKQDPRGLLTDIKYSR